MKTKNNQSTENQEVKIFDGSGSGRFLLKNPIGGTMKAILELSICNERHLRKPTTEIVGNEIVNTWEFNSISWSCQGKFDSVSFRYKKSEYNYNSAIQQLESFIKKNS